MPNPTHSDNFRMLDNISTPGAPATAETTNTWTAGPTEPFSRWLFAQRNGAAHAELTEALAKVALAVMETGKAGEINLRIRISKASRQGGHQMFVRDQITSKTPEADREETLYFFNEDTFSLTRHDPRQIPLPLQIIPVRDFDADRELPNPAC